MVRTSSIDFLRGAKSAAPPGSLSGAGPLKRGDSVESMQGFDQDCPAKPQALVFAAIDGLVENRLVVVQDPKPLQNHSATKQKKRHVPSTRF
jgi:hypothetical protein